jgi:hypothetical protein
MTVDMRRSKRTGNVKGVRHMTVTCTGSVDYDPTFVTKAKLSRVAFCLETKRCTRATCRINEGRVVRVATIH